MLPYRDSRILRIALILFFVILIGYAVYESQGLLYGPRITIPTSAITLDSPYTTIKGRAERITELRLNGKSIPVTEQGAFEEPYLLAEGSNRIVLEASDARGRKTTQILDIIYRPVGQSATTTL